MGRIARDIILTVAILGVCLILCLFIQNVFKTNTLIPAIFVLGVFLTSVITEGYTYGVISALASVLAVNFAFTFPYFKLNFTIPENMVSAIILIIVSLITCALTTKLKRQEAIKAEGEKERMRANLLRAVSHDLRTPLTTIYSSSSALLENYNEFSEEQSKKMLHGIKDDSQWLIRMVENLLSITKLGSGNVKIIKTETVLDELIDYVLVKFKKRYPDQEVIVDLPDDFIVIPMDALLIEQVIMNILENTMQHAYGMTEITIRVFVISDKAIFEIQDNGCGIAEDKLKNIFTGYYTSNELPPDGRNNAGIGLSVCASIIRAHNGDIHVENLKNGGALFRFSLDVEDSENEQ